jgi:membrane AbrB-like protein
MTNLGQLFIGVALGTRFTPAFLHTAPRWLLSVGAGTLVMIALSAGFALGVARLSGLHPATVLLGTSPGGIAEMCLTAKVLELGVPVVTAFHVTRMAAVVLLASPMFRWSAPTG